MKLPDPPDGLLVIPLAKSCILLLTPKEYLAGIRRGKWWKRRQAELARQTLSSRSPKSPAHTP